MNYCIRIAARASRGVRLMHVRAATHPDIQVLDRLLWEMQSNISNNEMTIENTSNNSYHRFERSLQEARNCVADVLQSSGVEEFRQEAQCADSALEYATQALVDWLEDVRFEVHSDESQQSQRDASVVALRSLRCELEALKKQKQD